jgi:cellulose biosynthesis protein BcsQ
LAADVLPNLNDTIITTQKHLNPNLDVLGVVLTKTDRRQKISKVFEENIGKAYRLLGTVHSEASLQYAVGGGTLHELQRSRSLGEYAEIGKVISELVWQTEKSLAAA